MVAGDLTIESSGHPSQMLFEGKQITLSFGSLMAARTMSSIRLPNPDAIGNLLQAGGFSLHANVGQRGSVELFPNPGLLVRLMFPQVRALAKA